MTVDKFAQSSGNVGQAVSAGTTLLAAVVSGYLDYAKAREVETTKRTEIAVRREIALAHLSAQRDYALKLFDGVFSERRESISKLFDRIDKSIDSGNLEALEMYLSSVIGILRTDPTHGFLSFCEKFDSDDDMVIDVE